VSAHPGVYQVLDLRDRILGTVHRGTDAMTRYWYAYDACGYVGVASARLAAGRLLFRRRRRRTAPKE